MEDFDKYLLPEESWVYIPSHPESRSRKTTGQKYASDLFQKEYVKYSPMRPSVRLVVNHSSTACSLWERASSKTDWRHND